MGDEEGAPKSRRGGELGTRPTRRIANSKKAVAARVDWNHVSHITNYPPLRIGVLRALQNLKRHYSADNEIFDRDDCPYDMDVRAVLKEILTVEVRIEEKIVEKRVVNDGSAARKEIGRAHV